MESNIRTQALTLVNEALKELENSKGSVASGILKLSRAARLVGKDNTLKWCEVHLGNREYIEILQTFVNNMQEYNSSKKKKNESDNGDKIVEIYRPMLANGFVKYENREFTFLVLSTEEISMKADDAAGGFQQIGYLEEICSYLYKSKRGNSGNIYLHNVSNHLQLIRKIGHRKASLLHKNLAFENETKSSFEILKIAVEDKLLDFSPDLAEQLITAFKSLQSENREEWSQSLTTCRRFIEALADLLYPPSEEKINGRVLNKSNYINRLWAFMDKKIESESNKELAKSHIDFVGSYLQKTFRLSNKGVHAEITKIEAIKTVFHTYLIAVDLLSHLKKSVKQGTLLDINSASIDEIEITLEVSRTVAKQIVKKRMEDGRITKETISSIKGITKKAIQNLEKFQIGD